MQQPQKTWVPSLGQEDLLEKEIETHSSVSVWRTPWTGEPGGLYTVRGVTKSQTQLGRLSTQHRQALVHSPSRKTCSVAWQNPRCPEGLLQGGPRPRGTIPRCTSFPCTPREKLAHGGLGRQPQSREATWLPSASRKLLRGGELAMGGCQRSPEGDNSVHQILHLWSGELRAAFDQMPEQTQLCVPGRVA